VIEIKMIEKIRSFTTNMEADPRNVPAGWAAVYTDELYDEKGSELIGAAFGVNHAIYKRESDGHMIQYVTEQFQLPEGTLSAEGPMDREAVIAQEWVSIPIRGTGGLFLGMAGLWRWRLFDLSDPLMPLYSNITLGP
jgi:hypothetical protein